MLMKVINRVWGEAGRAIHMKIAYERHPFPTCHAIDESETEKMYKNRNQRELLLRASSVGPPIKITQKFRSHFGADFYFYLACSSPVPPLIHQQVVCFQTVSVSYSKILNR